MKTSKKPTSPKPIPTPTNRAREFTVLQRHHQNLIAEYFRQQESIETLTAEVVSLRERVTDLSKRELASCEINKKLVDVNEERKEKIEMLKAEVNLLARLLNASTSAVDFLTTQCLSRL